MSMRKAEGSTALVHTNFVSQHVTDDGCFTDCYGLNDGSPKLVVISFWWSWTWSLAIYTGRTFCVLFRASWFLREWLGFVSILWLILPRSVYKQPFWSGSSSFRCLCCVYLSGGGYITDGGGQHDGPSKSVNIFFRCSSTRALELNGGPTFCDKIGTFWKRFQT